MSTPEERLQMAQAILDFEARRDRQGRLAVYILPSDDGGGTYEVAGINERYHPEEARQLAELIEAGQHDEAEALALEIIATFTDAVGTWSKVAAIESYLRDCAFNRGPRGAARILQRAVGTRDDGVVGPRTRAALAERERDPVALLHGMRAARERYEREVVGRDESSRFWRGLVNRWNKALDFAIAFLPAGAGFPAGGGRFRPAAEAAEAMGDAAGGATPATTLLMSAGPTLSPASAPVTLAALRIGSRGDLVRSWQTFLRGQGFDPGGLDGHFGDRTHEATKAFRGTMG